MRKQKLAHSLSSLILIVILLFFMAFAFDMTNGFTQDLRAIYLRCNDRYIYNEAQMTFDAECAYKFDIYYLDFLNQDNDDYSYDVSIVSNVEQNRRLTYNVDGKTHLWQSDIDITNCFRLQKSSEYFTFEIPKDTTFATIVQSFHSGVVTVSYTEDLSELHLYTIVVSFNDGESVFYIDFSIVFDDVMPTGIDMEDYIVF